MFTVKKYLFKTAAFVMIAALLSCEGIFIYDPIDPRLPKYTHEGNNVAGAFINGEQWKSVVYWDFYGVSNKPVFKSYANDSLTITFYGNTESAYNVLLHFTITGWGIHEFSDLEKLRGIKIPLDGLTNTATLSRYRSSCYETAIGTGQFYAKDITVRESGSMIFSGTFGFTIEDADCGTTEVSYGRFDYTVGKSGFHAH